MIINGPGVYEIYNTKTGKRYIGSAKNIRRRIAEHKRCLKLNNHHSIHLQNAWNVYGGDYFVFSVIEKCTVEGLLIHEQFYIDKFNSADPEFGYNLCPNAGNSLGRKVSDETRSKMSESHVGKKYAPRTQEQRAQMSKVKKGNKSKLGNSLTEETKRKISLSKLGEKNGMYGKKMSDEAKQKISDAQKLRHKKQKSKEVL